MPCRLQRRRHRCVTLLRLRLVIPVGEHRRHTQFARQPRYFVARPAVPDDQRAAARPQRVVEFEQRPVDELDAPISIVAQRIDDLAIEDEGAMNAPRAPQCLARAPHDRNPAGRAETRQEWSPPPITFVSAAAAD
jgi:hypothetical protein